MQLICDYKAEPPVIVGHYPDEVTVDMAHEHLSDYVLVPFSGALESLPRVGPEPELMGDPPTKRYPSREELTAEGLGEDHWLWAKAGQPYPDNRRLAADTRSYAAPAQSDPVAQLAYLAHVRWTVEVGGVDVDGFPAFTSRETRGQTEADAGRAARDPKFSKRVKGTDGKFYDLDAAKLIAVADKVSDHVQSCFDLESKMKDAIAAGKVKNFAAIDGAFATL